MSTVGERLRASRIAIGMNQKDFGELGGVRKQAQLKYEQDARKPDAEYLQRIAQRVDVEFILTGVTAEDREVYADVHEAAKASSAIGGTAEQRAVYQIEAYDRVRARRVNDEELSLVQDYRACTPPNRETIRNLAAQLAKLK